MANGSSTTSIALLDCTQAQPESAERVNYFPRQLLTADDMFADQDYFRLKLQRHNRFMHGWGTVCGLVVTAAPTANSPWLVQISGGYALGPYGDEIFVGEPVNFDLSTCGSAALTNPCEPDSQLGTGRAPSTGSLLYIAIQYAECMARPVSVTPAGCGCEQTACQNSRIAESFQIQCLASLPSSYQTPSTMPSLCATIASQELPECLVCPGDPWVLLAAVTLPTSLNSPVVDSSIDNVTLRRQIYSTAVLQEQLYECCCAPTPTPTPTPTPSPASAPVPTTVTSINFTPNQRFNAGEAPQFIRVTFSQPIVRSTLTASTFLVTATVLHQTVDIVGKITYDATSSLSTLTATFTPTSSFPELAGPTINMTLIGTPPPAPVTDIHNQALDGNGDGVPGGNYSRSFSIGVQL
jgi:hypothetical protein